MKFCEEELNPPEDENELSTGWWITRKN